MARSGWSTSNFLRASSAVVSGVPLSMACWGNTSITGAVQVMMGVVASASTASFQLLVTIGNLVVATTDDGASSGGALSTAAVSAGSWFHACGVWDATNSRAAFLNGANKGTETTDLTPAGLNRTSIGVEDRAAPDPAFPFAPAGTGRLAEAGIWNVALSDADVASLARGIHPFLVRPDKLVAYWPLIGTRSPETNFKSNTATMAIQGALSQAAHPRIFQYPKGNSE